MTDVARTQKIIWEQDMPRLTALSPEVRGMGWDVRDQGVATGLIGLRENGATDLMLGTWEMQQGEVHLLHHHPNASEAYYVIDGNGEFTIDDEVVKGGPGLALYMPPNTRHRIFVNGPSPLVLLWVFSKADFEEIGVVWDE